jgi:hypothetical protein
MSCRYQREEIVRNQAGRGWVSVNGIMQRILKESAWENVLGSSPVYLQGSTVMSTGGEGAHWCKTRKKLLVSLKYMYTSRSFKPEIICFKSVRHC